MNEERMHQILLRPIVSVKSTTVAEKHHQVVFEVLPDASKAEVRDAVEKLFDVNVENVRVINVRGKVKRFGRTPGQRSNWKKAIITLHDGHSIDILDGEV